MLVFEDPDDSRTLSGVELYEYWGETGNYNSSDHVFVPHGAQLIYDLGTFDFNL